MVANIGFDAIRKNNRACWAELWKSRIRLVGAEKRWQAMADAAFFYLMSSAHPSSPASTSMFGLATWHDYHYYFGHVMWDIETFCVPPLVFLQPDAAQGILDYRLRNLESARSNARLMGRRGLQFPWESAPSSGEEAAPMPGSAAWREDHASLDIARAFALCADVTGDDAFLRDKAWPVLSGVAEWVKSRVTKRRGKYEIRASMGIAERKSPSDNAVFTNLSARTVLHDAISAANRLNRPVDPAWIDIATKMVVPKRGKVVISHDAFRVDEEKAATPDPLMGIFPLGCGFDEEIRASDPCLLSENGKTIHWQPNVVGPVRRLGRPHRQQAAFLGDAGARLWLISAPADLCKRWNTAKTYFLSNRQPGRSLQISAAFCWD